MIPTGKPFVEVAECHDCQARVTVRRGKAPDGWHKQPRSYVWDGHEKTYEVWACPACHYRPHGIDYWLREHQREVVADLEQRILMHHRIVEALRSRGRISFDVQTAPWKSA